MLKRLLINAIALAIAAWVIPGITLTGDDWGQKTWALVLVAVIFGLLNALVKPIIKVITAPAILLSLGLFLVVINMVMLMLTSWVTGQVGLAFHVDGWLAALLGSLLISAVSWVVSGIFDRKKKG